jgi:E3 ubiquitin-protein ligase SHPRH
MLEIVAEALRLNGLKITVCFNRDKDFESSTTGIESFRNDPDVRTLLMPLSLGAEGLDLIIASHVFLLEPLLNQAQEAQAVNRIDRIGQDKITYVHKYLIQETIEERIVEFQSSHTEQPTPQKTKKTDDAALQLADIRYILDLTAED